MDTSRFGGCGGDGGAFRVLELTARCLFKSATSISFQLDRDREFIRRDDSGAEVHRRTSLHVGRVDVHHPCKGHIKTQLLVMLPDKYHSFEPMRDLVAGIFEALGIPADETFESLFVSPGKQAAYENATDRDGMSDRFYSRG
jgi:hypothetical protein